MSAITDHTPLRMVPFRVPTTRLALKPMSASARSLDGAWWPRSRDLPGELSALAEVLDPLWGRITRVAVNPRYWPVIPRKVLVNGHVVKVDWFARELDPHKIMLLSHTAGRWDLLVIPPETSAPAAARLMAAASESSGLPMNVTALMTAEKALHDGPTAVRRAQDQRHEEECGRA
ncbi:hypothetical protein FE633_07195 [Streptomyces montanus]|uniref:Uncharacterized protein n=1 Tax=Streptomyces montanus TaxID=2580423 RepID=A0A5R9G036_9ACTN|nr:DUF5994 family protein [Streptomyces montanus]TLS46878.1 hypothetical protein FE633_07195 [Streptomyces montanus]